MANGVRTIYSPRQRMAPGQYETPLADFLEKVPNYILQFEEMKLARDRQQLQEERYKDSVNRQNRLDNEAKSQREYTNELNVFKMLPEGQILDAMSTSKIPEIKAIGDKGKDQRQEFTDQINKVYTDNVGDSSAILTGLEGLLSNPDIRSNKTRISQIQDHIDRETPKVARQQINQWAQDNPNDPRVKAIVMQSKTDPDGALKAIVPTRPTMSTIQRGVWNPYTKVFDFKTDAEIAAGKLTDTKDDDWIPKSAAPKQGGKEQSLTQINERIDSITKRLRRPDKLTPEEIDRLTDALKAWEIKADELSAIELPSGPDLNLPLTTTPAESTKTIPGW